MHIHMLARTHIRRARCRRYHDENNETFTRKRARSSFLLFGCVSCFIYQFARTSGCSNGLIMNYFVTRIRHCTYIRARGLSIPLSLFLYRIRWSNGNSELYVRIYVCMRARVCVRVRAWRNNTCIRGVFFVVGTKTRSARCILCVCGRHQDWALSRTNQIIVSRSPSPSHPSPLRSSIISPFSSFALRPTESAYVQSLRHWW